MNLLKSILLNKGIIFSTLCTNHKAMQQFLFGLIIFLFSISTYGQDQVVQQSDLAEAEFHTAINPTDEDNIVVVTMHGFQDVTDSYFSIYYTRDFGETWEKSEFEGMHQGHDGTGDPVVAFNAEGELFLTHLVVLDDYEVKTILSKSVDGGETWDLAYEHPDIFTDKPWIAIDKSEASPHKGNIYIPTVSLDLILISLNESAELISEVEMPDGDHIPSVVTAKNGTVFTSNMKWTDPISLYVQKYSDGGSTLNHSTFVVTFPDYTFNADDVSTRFQPAPYLAIDNSDGAYSGRLYLSYTASENVNPDYFNVFITYSDDEGLTWSEPKIVHSDTTDFIQQFYSSIYVNNKGVLMLDWYDRSNFDNSTLLTDFKFGVSYDGGENFQEVQLNSESMDFLSTIPAGFGFGIGEYHQLVATDEVAISFWSDGRTNDGDLNIYFAKIDIDNPISNVLEQSIIKEGISISNIYPQPVENEINIDLDLKNQENLKFEILNLNTQQVFESPFTIYPSGQSTYTQNIELTPGHYIFKVRSDKGYFKNLKFVVTK